MPEPEIPHHANVQAQKMVSHKSPDIRGLLPIIFALALLAVVVLEIAPSFLPRDNESIFWLEFRQDRFAAWTSLFCLFLGLLVAKIGARWNFGAVWNFAASRALSKVGLVCLGSIIVYAFLMQVVAFAHPFVPDEYCAVLQSQIFATGQVNGKIPPDLIKPFFSQWLYNDFILSSAKSGVFSPTYWPGYAILMAPFSFFNLSWLCNSAITALALFFFFLVGRQLGKSTEAGWWALIFALVSPVIALNAATYFSMPAHLLANLVFCWLLIQDRRWMTFLAGLLGGFALVLHNPVPHATFALPWIVWVAFKRRNHLLPLLAGYAILAAPLGLGWSTHLDSFGAGRYVNTNVGSQATQGESGSLFSQVLSRVAYVFQPPSSQVLLWRGASIIKTIVWACPGLIALSWYGWKATKGKTGSESGSGTSSETYLRILAASVIFTFAFYLFVRYDQGHGWGFRYLHNVWLAFPLLSSFFLSRLPRGFVLKQVPVKRFVAFTALFSLMLVLPLQALQGRAFMQTLLDNEAGNALLAMDNSQKNHPSEGAAIVFLKDQEGYYRFTLIQNDPFLRNGVWRFRFLSVKENGQIAKKYLRGARLKSRAKWGEIWLGESFSYRAHS